MQVGLRESFEYGHCMQCGAITRLSLAPDMKRYYPSNYYAHCPSVEGAQRALDRVRDFRDRVVLTGKGGVLSGVLADLSSEAVAVYRLIGMCRPKLDARVLDVGCGDGKLLKRMAAIGFTDLTGVDRFISDVKVGRESRVRMIRGELSELNVDEHFDLIMLHHSFEHFENQRAALESCVKLLSVSGLVLLRQPLSDSEAFEIYGPNWFQLDAPRHNVIHSEASFRMMAKECGLCVKQIVRDSTDMQFWASEQYRGDVPMYSERSYFRGGQGHSSLFSPRQIASFKKRARELNRRGRGDQGAFVMKKA